MTTPKRNPKITDTILETTEDTDPMSSLRSKLKTAAPEIQNYVTALEKENFKLVAQIAKLQAENVTLNNMVKAIREENPPTKLNIQFSRPKSHDTSNK